MTVAELIQRLQEVADEGLGDLTVYGRPVDPYGHNPVEDVEVCHKLDGGMHQWTVDDVGVVLL